MVQGMARGCMRVGTHRDAAAVAEGIKLVGQRPVLGGHAGGVPELQCGHVVKWQPRQ